VHALSQPGEQIILVPADRQQPDLAQQLGHQRTIVHTVGSRQPLYKNRVPVFTMAFSATADRFGLLYHLQQRGVNTAGLYHPA